MSKPRIISTETAFLHYMAKCRQMGEPKPDAFLDVHMTIGVTLRTLERWETSLKDVQTACRLNQRSPRKVFAKGQTLLRLRCFLQRKGYRVKEFESLHSYLRELAEILSTGMITLEYATDHLKYANSRQLINALNNGAEIDPPRMALLRQLVG